MKKAAKLIRILTIAPLMAAGMLILLFFTKPEILGGLPSFWCAILFLTVLPILAYPMQPLFPHYRELGREGQRSLAILFAVAGYILGCVSNLFFSAGLGMWIIYLEYLLSGMGILICNKVFRLKASGHACGVAGPVVLLIYFGVPAAIFGTVLLGLVLAASLITKRHTWQQFLGGAFISVASMCLLVLIFNMIL